MSRRGQPWWAGEPGDVLAGVLARAVGAMGLLAALALLGWAVGRR